MKQLLLILASVVLVCSYSSAATPPKPVQKAFEKRFPTATKITWGKESAKEWEAEFTFEGNKISANFFQDGSWLETEQEIKIADLPKAVADAIKLKYSSWLITEADRTESSKHGIIYEADLKLGVKKMGVAFKEDGTPIKE